MKYKATNSIIFVISILVIIHVSCNSDHNSRIIGTWYYLGENKTSDYSEVYISDSIFWYYSDIFDEFKGPDKFFVENDSIKFISRAYGEGLEYCPQIIVHNKKRIDLIYMESKLELHKISNDNILYQSNPIDSVSYQQFIQGFELRRSEYLKAVK